MPWLNIAALAERTGVAAHTLRKWEERYGVIAPARSPGGQRRYTELDVARVEWLRDRLADGYRISEAAELLGPHGGGSPGTAPEVCDALYEAIRSNHPDTVDRLLDQAFALHPLPQALAEIVGPVLERVGLAWASGEPIVAEEHLLSAGIRSRIERLLADPRAGTRGRAVLACAPGERHELGLLALAVFMRADGWSVVYLGADTPLPDAIRLAERVNAHLLCLSLALPERGPELIAALGQDRRDANPRLVLGGAAATPLLASEAGAVLLGPDLEHAVRALRGAGR